MLKNQRHLAIIEYVNEHQFAKVEELSQLLNVSEITIRRDINELHEENVIKKVHGGASSLKQNHIAMDIELELRRTTNADEKLKIAKIAADYIPDDSSIYLDAGTSTSLVIPYLENKNVTVFTHGLHHIEMLNKYNIDTYIIGGHLKTKTLATVGSLSIKYLERMNFDIALIGFNALDSEFGYSTPDEMEAMIKATIIKHSNVVYFLGDESKFGRKSGMSFAQISDGYLVSNKHPGDKYLNIKVIK
ncbi:DeoR/GlpR transcriptional regulator [Erysipelothrix sp. HDW6B]|uniref:DeoR/GlpR family DNA-binding transcription regulator n=1 Tax=Erysipelothrix TaxID=1647 RepID=UPI001357ADD1|nr:MULTISPECIES: DeoR/GlpR family DNA-binding transcription regulator [Erysipelothrix]QIK85225.1 DeoR/GlpR transcriptional regulator [Erysipelothrix sp. HDW6B]